MGLEVTIKYSISVGPVMRLVSYTPLLAPLSPPHLRVDLGRTHFPPLSVLGILAGMTLSLAVPVPWYPSQMVGKLGAWDEPATLIASLQFYPRVNFVDTSIKIPNYVNQKVWSDYIFDEPKSKSIPRLHF